jgi:hypothetical protein
MYLLFLQVACALLMAGENLDNHVDVKNVLVEMGTYFQVQVLIVSIGLIFCISVDHSNARMLHVLVYVHVCRYQFEISYKKCVLNLFYFFSSRFHTCSG